MYMKFDENKFSLFNTMHCLLYHFKMNMLNRNDGRFYQRHVLFIHLVIHLYSSERVLIFIKSSKMLGQYLFLREPHRVNIRIEGYPFSRQIFSFLLLKYFCVHNFNNVSLHLYMFLFYIRI